MPNKRVLVVAGIVVVAGLLLAGQLAFNRTAPQGSIAETPVATFPSRESTTAPPSMTTTESGAASAATRTALAPLPGGKPLRPVRPTGPAATGARLHPLLASPTGLVAGLAVGNLRTGARYAVTFRPWGYGPAGHDGQTVAITMTNATPVGGAPSITSLVRRPLLVVMDSGNGGDVAVGGAHRATLTFVADAARLSPVLSEVRAGER